MIKDAFARYLLQDTGFRRVTDLWIRQYQKPQHFEETMCIESSEDSEREAIGDLLGKGCWGVRGISIPYSVWEKAIEDSQFAGSDFFRVLEIYREESMLTNKGQKEVKAQKEQQDMRSLSKRYAHIKTGEWLDWMQEASHKSHGSIRQLLSNNEWQTVYFILDTINQLPVWKQKIETMVVFASTVTRSPHFFDKDIENTLLFQGICYFLDVEERDISLAERNKLHHEAGLLKNDSSSSCMVVHLNTEDRDGKVHGAQRGFFDRCKAWTVSLYNLWQIHNISDAIKAVYIVESPSVFRSLSLEGKKLGREQIGFVCINSQPNLCSYVLLDPIQKGNIPMYYVGDFDPEGILITGRLKQRYEDGLRLWKSTVEDYHRIMSTSSIRKKRLLPLQNCRSGELQALCRELERHACSGYREALLSLYIEEIKNS